MTTFDVIVLMDHRYLNNSDDPYLYTVDYKDALV